MLAGLGAEGAVLVTLSLGRPAPARGSCSGWVRGLCEAPPSPAPGCPWP